MPRCPDCKRFVSIEQNEPEVEALDIDDEGLITASVRIVNVCAECNADLTEATLEMEDDTFDLNALTHTEQCSTVEILIEEEGSERIERVDGKGRAAKKFYGAIVTCKIYCGTCNNSVAHDIQDDVQASLMETMT